MAECLPSKDKALSSNPITRKKKKKKRKNTEPGRIELGPQFS
jgi:hypothetical protein